MNHNENLPFKKLNKYIYFILHDIHKTLYIRCEL